MGLPGGMPGLPGALSVPWGRSMKRPMSEARSRKWARSGGDAPSDACASHTASSSNAYWDSARTCATDVPVILLSLLLLRQLSTMPR